MTRGEVSDSPDRPGDGRRHHLQRLNQRLRQAFLAGAEEDSRHRPGRGLTAEELVRVLRRYPGDIARNERGPETRRP